MTATLADASRSPLSRRALHRCAAWLGLATRTGALAPVPQGIDTRALAQLPDHLLRDVGFVRELGPRTNPPFPSI